MGLAKFEGVFPVLAAPFTDNGGVDYDGLRNLTEFQIEAGASGVTLFGFATEFYKLSASEKIEMLKVTKDAIRSRIPLIASVTEQSTDMAVWSAREMEENGADALMVLPPFLIPPGATGFANHVVAVAQAVRIPVIVQYSPQETGTHLEAKSLVELMRRCSNLEGLKVECKPPGPMISSILANTDEPLKILVGYAGLQMIDALRRGAVGIMPGSSFTDVYCQIYALYSAGRFREAIELHCRLVPFLNLIFQSIEMIVKWEKVILKRRGIISSDYCRQPTYEPDKDALESFDIYYSRMAEDFSV